jgi:hypothetical protein
LKTESICPPMVLLLSSDGSCVNVIGNFKIQLRAPFKNSVPL